MKTIVHNGKRYNVAFINYTFGVVVDLPEREIYGHVSRMSIPLKELTQRQRKLVMNELSSV